MKNYRVVIKPQAERDLKQLNHYLKAKFGDATAASVIAKLKKSILGLGKTPNLGRNAADLSPVLVNYQYLHLPKNTIFYQVSEDQQLVIIIRIYNNRTDIIAHLLADITDSY